MHSKNHEHPDPERQPQWLQRGIAIGLFLFGILILLLALFAAILVVRGPGLVQDSDLIAREFSPIVPGFEDAQLLERLSKSTQRQRWLRFQTSVDTPAGSVLCTGTMIYHQQQPSTSEIAWDSDACSDAVFTIDLARKVLRGASLTHYVTLYGQARVDDIKSILEQWKHSEVIE